jgi:hypothetical protein
MKKLPLYAALVAGVLSWETSYATNTVEQIEANLKDLLENEENLNNPKGFSNKVKEVPLRLIYKKLSFFHQLQQAVKQYSEDKKALVKNILCPTLTKKDIQNLLERQKNKTTWKDVNSQFSTYPIQIVKGPTIDINGTTWGGTMMISESDELQDDYQPDSTTGETTTEKISTINNAAGLHAEESEHFFQTTKTCLYKRNSDSQMIGLLSLRVEHIEF